MTLLYPYRSSHSSEELRYSLRSVAKNLPHDNVLIVGDRPDWLTNVDYLEVAPVKNKHLDIQQKVMAALGDERLSADFIYMNDDFFVMESLSQITNIYNRGTIDEVIAEIDAYGHKGGDYRVGMEVARDLLLKYGLETPMSYELHIPMAFNKSKLTQLLDSTIPYYENHEVVCLQFRTIYGNVDQQPGETVRDVKVRSGQRSWPHGSIFLSTDNNSFNNGSVGQHIKDLFQEPSKYER